MSAKAKALTELLLDPTLTFDEAEQQAAAVAASDESKAASGGDSERRVKDSSERRPRQGSRDASA